MMSLSAGGQMTVCQGEDVMAVGPADVYQHKKFKSRANLASAVVSHAVSLNTTATVTTSLVTAVDNVATVCTPTTVSRPAIAQLVCDNDKAHSPVSGDMSSQPSEDDTSDVQSSFSTNSQSHPGSSLSLTTMLVGKHRCPFCGNFFAKPSVLDKHIRSHTNERPFSCSVCKYSFKTKSNFVKHCKTRKHAAHSADAEACSDDEEDSSTILSDVETELSDLSTGTSVRLPLSETQVRFITSCPARSLSHSIDSIIGRNPEPANVRRSESPIVHHIDKVIELNEMQLSVSRRALDNFGRHTSTLGRERESIGRLSSLPDGIDSATIFRPSVLVRSQSLCSSVDTSHSASHVLKRRLLSGAEAADPGAQSSKRRRLSGASTFIDLQSLGRSSSCFTGGQMLIMDDSQCASGESPVDDRAPLHSLSSHADNVSDIAPLSPHVMTIKSNLNSGGKMIEVCSSGSGDSGGGTSSASSTIQSGVERHSCGLHDTQSDSTDTLSARHRHDVARHLMTQSPRTSPRTEEDGVSALDFTTRLSGSGNCQTSATSHDFHDKNSVSRGSTIGSAGGCDAPIDLCVRAECSNTTLAAAQLSRAGCQVSRVGSRSPVLCVFSETDLLDRLYTNVGRVQVARSSSSSVVVDAAAAAAAAASRRRRRSSGHVTVTSAGSARTVSGVTVSCSISTSASRAIISTATTSISTTTASDNGPSEETVGETSSHAPPSPAAPPTGPAAGAMQAVLDDIFKQVRTERASAGMGPAAAAGETATVAASAGGGGSDVRQQQQMHPNVTAGQPGLALTRTVARDSADPSDPADTTSLSASQLAAYRNSDRLVCPICKKQDFVNRNQLSAHTKTHQMDQRRHRCNVCDVAFRSEKRLSKHCRTSEHLQKATMLDKLGKTQTDRRIYECLFCMRGFHNVGMLHKHLRCKTHVTGLENAGWLPCGVYAQLELAGVVQRTDGPDCVNVHDSWANYCHLQDLSLVLLKDRQGEMYDWRRKFEQIRQGQLPSQYPYEVDPKLRGNTDPGRARPVFPDDFSATVAAPVSCAAEPVR